MKIHKEGSVSYHFTVNVRIWLQFTLLILDTLVCIDLTIILGCIWYHYFLSQIFISIYFTWTRPFLQLLAVFGWDITYSKGLLNVFVKWNADLAFFHENASLRISLMTTHTYSECAFYSCHFEQSLPTRCLCICLKTLDGLDQ